MTENIMSNLIQTSVKSITTFFAPFMELPPNERTFCFYLKKKMTETLYRWLEGQKIDYETNPWKLQLGSQTHRIKEFRFERPFIKIYQGFWEKGWVFLKINTAPSKINLVKFDLKQLNWQLEGCAQKFQIVGLLVVDLPKRGIPICYLALKTSGERFNLHGNTLSEVLDYNHFIKFEAQVAKESINEFDYRGKTLKEMKNSKNMEKFENLEKSENQRSLKEKTEYFIVESVQKFLSGKPYPDLRDLGRNTLNYLLNLEFNHMRYDLNSNDENWDVSINYDTEIKLSMGDLMPINYLQIYRFANEKKAESSKIFHRKEVVATVRWRLLFQDSWEHINSVFPLLNSDLESGRVMGACALILSWPHSFYLDKWEKERFKKKYLTKRELKEEFKKISCLKSQTVVNFGK